MSAVKDDLLQTILDIAALGAGCPELVGKPIPRKVFCKRCDDQLNHWRVEDGHILCGACDEFENGHFDDDDSIEDEAV
jgi:hypothetical protein